MSRRGELTVECDTGDCYAQVTYRIAELIDFSVEDALSDEGWKRIGGKDKCPACLKADGPKDDDEAWAGGFAENH